MGDYAEVQLYVALEHFEDVMGAVSRLDLEQPTETALPPRDPTGRPKKDACLVWEQLRSGIEYVQPLAKWMVDQKIPYTLLDGGCWGVWPEEEEKHRDGEVERRILLQREPVVMQYEWRTAKARLSREGPQALVDWVDDHFSDDPARWVP